MGMYGYYFAIDDKLVQQIATGEIALENLKIEDYLEGEPPLSYVVPMTTERGIDFGSFGAFFLRAEQVAPALQIISELNEAQLRLRYDFPTMIKDEVYPLEPGMVLHFLNPIIS